MVAKGKCKCGCGAAVDKGVWLPGHDHRAVHQRIRTNHGSVANFVEWYDQHYKAHTGRTTRTRRTAA